MRERWGGGGGGGGQGRAVKISKHFTVSISTE